MSDAARKAFERAMTLTQEMFDVMEQGLFDDLIALDKERDSCFNICFPLPLQLQTEATQQALKQMLSLNEQLENHCRDAKYLLAQEIETFSSSRKAIKAYQSS